MRRLVPLLLFLCPAISGCAIFGGSGLGPVTRENAAGHLEAAQEEIAAGKNEEALERLSALRSLSGLDPDQRALTEQLLESASNALLSSLEGSQASSDVLLELYEGDLAPRTRARAGVQAADRMLAEGHAIKAWKQIRDVEKELPAYIDRVRAGDVLGRAGLELIRRPGHYYLFFRYASRGKEALEFLVDHYPFDHRAPEAYTAIVELYASRLDYDDAISRAEDQVIYHPDTPEAIAMQARLPELRLGRLERDDNDRSEMVQARSELEYWVDRYAGREGTPEDEARVRATLRECNRRLAENDLVVARFYDTVDESRGARLHAERALESARAAEAASAIAEAERLLALHPAELSDDESGGESGK